MIDRWLESRRLTREHRFADARLSAYLDRELAEGDYRRVRDHIARCPECRQAVEQLARTVAALKRLRLHGTRDPIVDRLIARLRAEA